MATPGIVRGLEQLSSITWLLFDTATELAERLFRRRAPFRASVFFEQTYRAGVGSVPLVAMVSFFLGLTMALLTGYQLQPYGTEHLVPQLITVAFVRELGPLLTGIMVAARIGAAYTAELGTMTVAEEVEAIEAMGIGPLRFLVLPRLLAIFLLMPCLVVVSNLAAVGGAAVIALVQLDMSWSWFLDGARDGLLLRDIIAGVGKSLLFGLLVGLIACYRGLTVRGGAAGVGDATTSSVVTAVTTVIACDTLSNILLVGFYR